MKLADATYKNTSKYMIKGIYDYKTLSVHDGNTVWIAIDTPVVGVDDGTSESGWNDVWSVCCRIKGIDAPEIPRPYEDYYYADYNRAYAARDRVVELTTDITIDNKANHPEFGFEPLPFLSFDNLQTQLDKCNKCVIPRGLALLHGKDSYGRYLASLSTKDGKDVAQVLLDEGLADPQDPSSC